jgi:cell fate regulator YaaT (PSP1 superfamily)
MTEENKIETPTQTYKYMVSVRFFNTKKAYNFGTDDETFKLGEKVVVETIRGLELGELLTDARDISEFNISIPLKPVIRRASTRDIENAKRNVSDEPVAMQKCQECVNRLHLGMSLISAEYTLDRSKIVFSYVADERVDFRELLKQLASIFHCRIELRQIGPRDKAKIVGGLGPCGQETCCSRYMDDFYIVSINMAKNQSLALNTAKLSGQCGKLMCCLKYEDENYKLLHKNMPKINARIEYEGKKYRMTSMNALMQTVRLTNSEGAVDLTFDQLRHYLGREEDDEEVENETPEKLPE